MRDLLNELRERSGLPMLSEGKNSPAEMYEKIMERLSHKDGVVQVTTALRSWVFEHKHREMFRLSKDGQSLLMQRGKSWDDISTVNVRLGWLK